MARKPDEHKPDGRTPQQLAQAILDHPFDPGTGTQERSARTFGEQLREDVRENHPKPKMKERLFSVLETLAAGKRPDDKQRQVLRYSLLLTNIIRNELSGLRDDSRRRAKGRRDVVAERFISKAVGYHIEVRPPDDADWKEAQQSQGECGIMLNNIQGIEQLLRTLAEKLSITLDEPRRER